MYGYIVVNQPELKIKEYTLYKGHYCGLCHALKENYGNIPRLTLSYDLTFLTILLTSLYEEDTKIELKRCMKHLGKKQNVIYSKITDYVSDMSIVLSYLKCQDDIQDDQSFKAKIMKLFLSSDFQKVKEKYPDKVEKIMMILNELTVKEKTNDLSIDQMASYFGKVFGEVFIYQNDMWKDTLYNVGYFLGEFVYLLDAYDDYEEDLKNQLYNPFHSIENKDEYAKNLLEIVISECCSYFERLPIIENIDLLRNILYSGVWSKYYEKQMKGEKQDGSL